MLADKISKFKDSTGWAVSDRIFKFFDKIWGPFSADMFADIFNKKCDIFYSMYLCPGSAGVDAFCVSWKRGNLWLVPPVVPKWRSSAFWPKLCDNQGKLRNLVLQMKEFDRPSNFFVSNGRSKVFGPFFRSSVLVLRIDGSIT